MYSTVQYVPGYVVEVYGRSWKLEVVVFFWRSRILRNSELLWLIRLLLSLILARLKEHSCSAVRNPMSIIILSDASSWPAWFIGAYCCGIFLGLEILSHLIPLLFGHFNKIDVKGKHLDELSFQDNLFISINKCLTLVFVYHVVQVSYYTSSIKWAPEEANFMNTVGSLGAFYVVYDFFYANFHRILHFRSLYGIIHKHHHRQKAPSRGNLDAINVHPFEFVVGEYFHLFTIWLIPCHVYAVVVFVLLAGVFASLNHTRFDVNIPFVYSVKTHDVHHRLPESNYSQYTPLWDHIMGSFRPYLSVK